MSKELLALMHQLELKRFAKSPPKKMLYRIFQEIERKRHYGHYRTWELLVEQLAKWLVRNEETGLATIGTIKAFEGLSLKEDELYKHVEPLLKRYVIAAKNNPWDHLGELYTDQGLVGPGQNMTPRAIVEFMTMAVYREKRLDGKDEWFCYNSYRQYVTWFWLTYHVRPEHLKSMDPPVKTQLDPCVGTGRFLFVASQMMPKANLVLFGIEINLALYRACLVNMAMFSKHPYSIICADALRLGVVGPTSPIWDLGNRWNPPDLSAYYWKPPPIGPDRFSLKAFTELNKK